MEITGILVLAADTLITPVDQLSEELRRQIQATEGDCAVTRPHSRTVTSIVDGDAAKLLEEFRRPITVVQAVIQYCSVTSEDPESTLEAAFPMLERLVQARLLVPADSIESSSTRPLLKIGSHFAGTKVLECIQAVEDTDLYRVLASDGKTVALKLMHSTAGPEFNRMFEREARILMHLDATVTPALLAVDSENDLRYLLLSWCRGTDCVSVATGFRSSGDYAGLLRLSLAILNAYAHLHAQNVIHSDIHPHNILVDTDCSVRLVDFGLACIPGLENESSGDQRRGVGYFLEPEYANALRAKRQPPCSSAPGEQYSLGALLYFLATGKHYVDFSLERHEMLRQITEDGPLPFSLRGLEPWPDLEDILVKALAKEPASRFDSVADFATALGCIDLPSDLGSSTQHRPASYPTALETLTRTIKRLDIGAQHLQLGLTCSPRASITYGSAGVACALHRIACARQDPEILSLADLWGERATRDAGLEDAWYCSDEDFTPEKVGKISPYHTGSGVHFVRALIAHSMGDLMTQQSALDRFIAGSVAPSDCLDLTLGRSGILLAASHLITAQSPGYTVDDTALRELGNATMASIWQQLDSYAAIRECTQISYSGTAHGWAGILYATLCWSRASGAGLPSNTGERLDELADLAHRSGRHASWDWSIRSESLDGPGAIMAGWCNGSAGQAHLWLAAYSALMDDRYLVLADQAAMHAAETDAFDGSLCCGFSGQAYAALALYRLSGERLWLHRAQALAEKAAVSYRKMSSGDHPHADALHPDSLYKGELGVAVLAADLENPYAAIQPAFEYLIFPAP